MTVITYAWIDGTIGDWGTARRLRTGPGGVDGLSNATIAGSGTEAATVSANQAATLYDAWRRECDADRDERPLSRGQTRTTRWAPDSYYKFAGSCLAADARWNLRQS